MATRDWDATTYQRVSVPHQEWARSILDRLELSGDEVVLDAGCGSGRVTAMLIERLPRGRVVAVDGSPSMIEEVRSVLRSVDEARVADLIELELEEPVDAVFSSAVFHWILDHDALFRSLRRALKPGGTLAAQCGGAGNIDEPASRRCRGGLPRALPPPPRRFRTTLELRGDGGDDGEARAGGLRRSPLLAAAMGRDPPGTGRVRANRLPRPPARPPAGGAPLPVRRRRPRRRGRTALPGLRQAEHRGLAPRRVPSR